MGFEEAQHRHQIGMAETRQGARLVEEARQAAYQQGIEEGRRMQADHEQIRIANGEKLDLTEDPTPRGHSIEFRINGEDAGRGFLPAPEISMDKIGVGPGLPDGVVNLDASPEENLRELARAWAAKGDDARALEIVQGKCFICHGVEGESSSPVFPRLAGQHAEYTETTLKNFRDGARRNNAPMQQIAARLSDAEIKALADFAEGLRR